MEDEVITAKGFLFKLLNTAMNSYCQSQVDEKLITHIVISNDSKSFYFDVHDK